MKKRLLYICPRICVTNRFIYSNAAGLNKKLDCQKSCFEEAGYEVTYGVLDAMPSNVFPQITNINLLSTSMNWKKIDISRPVDVVYIRFYERSMEFGLIWTLHKIKQKNKDVKILFEFQTFPFNREYYFKNERFFYYRFQIFVRLLRFYVDRIILCTPDYGKIYGVKTLYMPNGVKYKESKIIPLNYNKNEIHLIAVSTMMNSHGYDRLIKGMGTYYQQPEQRKVILHLVGEGVQEKEYRKLVQNYGIADYVLFEGMCTGDKLDRLYLLADIGIDCFGMHRQGKNMVSSALKLCEAASYGLPIISAGKSTLDHEECMKYLLKFPDDETDIDVNKIISFYDKVYIDDKVIERNTIKEVFKPYYDIQNTLKKVIEYMEN